jgi:7,8-dihydropterin-6-yl-methyl-4-(beta-D-ribofuranosyl)aminobenzene 5'-phosphate synthase
MSPIACVRAIRSSMILSMSALLLSGCATSLQQPTIAAARDRITVLYDAFGKNPMMKKDWGYAALVEVNGRRILFDTGDNPDIFARNVDVAGVDLKRLDFVVLSHRHGDHMGGLTHLLSVNPGVKIYAPKEPFGVYGSSLPGTFYRRAEALPPEMRYYDGAPPAVMTFGSAWPGANFELIDQTTQIMPGVWLIALISDAPGTRELKELSLAVETPDGVVLVVGCSHPGIETIVEAASRIDTHIRVIAGGFHMVVSPDPAIAKVAMALKEKWKVDWIAPGHCTGEPTFVALREVFSERYLYAGLGTVLELDRLASHQASQAAPGVMSEDELIAYRWFAQRDAMLARLMAR